MGEVKTVKAAMYTNDIIGEIILTLNTPLYSRVIVVEGKFDKKLFEKFCDSTTAIVPTGNKSGVIDSINTFPKSEPRREKVIGICDADYDEPINNRRLFYYDYCNAEMMICSNESSRQKLFENAPENVGLYNLLSELKLRSCLRKLSIEKNLNLNIKKYRIIDYHNVYNSDNIWDTEFFSDYKSEIVELSRKYETEEQLLYITQGHDFRQLLEIFIKKKAHQDTSRKDMDEIFISAFGKDEFRATRLYGKIMNYSADKDIYFFLDF
jgi:hypothetical protein